MTGTISEISIVFKDKKTKTITSGNKSNGNIYLYKKSDGKLSSVTPENIKSGDVVYIKVDSDDGASSIEKVKGQIKCARNTGWVVNVERWTNYTGGIVNHTEQNFIRVVVWKNHQEISDPFEIEVKEGNLQIRKFGVSSWKWNEQSKKYVDTDRIPLNASFKIYCINNKQWVTGNAGNTKNYTDDFSQATTYTTKTEDNISQITINKLNAGYRYRIYEVNVEKPEYKDSKGIPRIVDVAWKNGDEWVHDDENQTGAVSWIDNGKEYPGFGNISIIYNGTKTVDVRDIKIPKEEIEIKIRKKDSNTNQVLKDVGLQVYKADAGWVAIDDEDGSTYFAESYSNATTYITGKDGKISVKDLTVGTYYIYENKASPNYSLNHQRTKYPDSKDPNKFAGKDEYSNIVYLGKKELKEEDKGKTLDNITYAQYILNTKLTILKKDGTLANMPLSGTKIKIYGNTSISNGWINQTNDGEYKFGTNENATEFVTNNTGEINLEKIPYGTYYVFETEVADKKHYNIKEQDGYHKTEDEQGNPIPGINEFPENADWVYLGNATIKESAEEIQFNAINKAYVSLKGKVWEDISADKYKTSGDNVYKNVNDILKKDIKVNLYNANDQIIAFTQTNDNGEYEFRYKGEQNKTNEQIKDEDKLTYWELASCYVEFIYDNKNYVVVDPFAGEDKTINSKAIEETMIQQSDEIDELKDEKLSGTDTEKKLPGRAVTYKGGRNLTFNEIIENANDDNKDLYTTPLTGYYNEETYTIEDINLGIIEKIKPEIYVGENLEYVKILMNGYTYTYKYGDTEILNSQLQFVPTVEKQKNKYDFFAKLYPTDIAYNIANNTDELKVYAVYSVGVKNNTTTHIDDIYNEQKLYLSELKTIYDSNRFELSNAQIGMNQEENKQFNLWNNGVDGVIFNINAEEKDGNVFANGIAENETKITHIQFRLKDDIIRRFLTDPDSVNQDNAATQVYGKGYHEYLRTDNVWVDNKDVIAFLGAKGKDEYARTNEKGEKYYVHKSEDCEDVSSALSLRFELGEDRKISGIVFEDKDENINDAERIGNGKFDDGEIKLKDVVVSLLNESLNVTKLYHTENKTTKVQNAIVISNDGSYELSGVVPGKYFLQFTYGNGRTEYKDLNGNNIEIATSKIDSENTSINPKLYKSTILTGNAKNSNDEKWFINDIGQNYSVATDLDNIINSRIGVNNLDTELNYKYENEGNTNEVINARSPKIDVNIGNTDKKIGAYDDNTIPKECTGMSFGIIERPHVNIELEKTIKNIKLTLQNGTTVINGNPEDSTVSPYLSSMGTGNARIEIDPSYIYGSNAVVTYSLQAHNKSELDYATSEYYKYGTKANNATPVTTIVTKIVDYLDNQNASYENQSENVTNNTEKLEHPEEYFTQEVINGNKNYKQIVFKTDKELLPEAATQGDLSKSSTDEYEFTINNLLASSDETLGWQSYSEIIGIKNVTLTPQSVSHSGNYIVEQSNLEPDTAEATVSIYSSTGENKNLITYYILGGALIIIALGVVLIKKFVIDTK
ncbi:MAG: hypothetical protein J5507_03980 [Clostridia bacterium]|nr:hypothetical protein [Clostridia bacterium]